MKIRWCDEKERVLKFRHGISFAELMKCPLVGIGNHPTRPHQKMMLLWWIDHVWVIPFVVDDGEIFLKTLYPSRKYTRLYKEGKINEEDQLE